VLNEELVIQLRCEVKVVLVILSWCEMKTMLAIQLRCEVKIVLVIILSWCEMKTMLAVQLQWRMEQSAVAIRVTEIAVL
jgi:hypothetical protein